MSINHETTDIWSVVIGAARRGGATDEEVANALGANINEVRRTLREMERMGWVEWPVDDEDDHGTFLPGEKAEECLRD